MAWRDGYYIEIKWLNFIDRKGNIETMYFYTKNTI